MQLLDPQFAYQAGIGMEDAIVHLLHRAYMHLDRLLSTVRVSAFDTVKPVHVAEKRWVMQVDVVAWITDYLTDRPQYVSL